MVTQRDKEVLKFIEEYSSITIDQCSKMFYQGKYAYYMARKRLRSLYENGIVKRYRKDMRSECYYYIDKKPSVHDSKALDVFAGYKALGCKINAFKREYAVNNYRIDALIELEYKEYFYTFILEVDYSHLTGMKKLDDMFFSGYFQENYKDLGEDIFPSALIVRPYSSTLKSKLYSIYNLDFSLSGLAGTLL